MSSVPKVVVVGGGFAGCAAAAAAAAARVGVQVTLLERMEVLGGWGPVAGRVDLRCLPVREELKLMGSDDIFQVIDACVLHKYVRFPFPKPLGAPIQLYDVTKLDPMLRKHLKGVGVEVRLQSRAIDVEMTNHGIGSVLLVDGTEVKADVFVDCTGGAGPQENCRRYGNGCAMCLMRCPAFGGRVSIAAKAGVREIKGKSMDGTVGPTNSAYGLFKESLAPEIRKELEQKGIVCIPIPPGLIHYERTQRIAASANVGGGFDEYVVLADIGAYAKRVAGGGYTPYDELRAIPGLEFARFVEPLAGAAAGNAGVRYMAITPRDNALKVPGVENLFVASEKLGINGVPAAIAAGTIAGHNAARKAMGAPPLVLPKTTLLGRFITFINERWNTEEGLRERYNIYRALGLPYPEGPELSNLEKAAVRSRIEKEGLLNILAKKV